MRKLVVWVLVVILVLGFVYVGGNLLEAVNGNVNERKSFDVSYLPYADTVLVSQSGESATNTFFPSLTLFHSQSSDNGETIYLYKNPISEVRIKETVNTSISPVDKTLYDFNKNGFTTNFYWENGFPIIDAVRVNKELFSSVWRNWEFTSSNKESLQSLLSAILQKGKLIKDDPDFQMLWQTPNDKSLYGIVYNDARDAFTEKLQIPFFKFSYPLYFSYDENKKEFTTESLNSVPQGSLFFKPFDFDSALLEIAEPETDVIKKLITNSGLQMIISEKLGLPFEKFSLFSSMNSGEFVLFNQSDFLFAVKSTPISNTLYRNEIMQLVANAKATSEKINNFSLVTYFAPNVRFYALEMPSMFIISTKKDALKQIAEKSTPVLSVESTSEFISVKKSFNDIATLYSLNVNPLKLPVFATSCTLTQTQKDGKLTAKITFGK